MKQKHQVFWICHTSVIARLFSQLAVQQHRWFNRGVGLTWGFLDLEADLFIVTNHLTSQLGTKQRVRPLWARLRQP